MYMLHSPVEGHVPTPDPAAGPRPFGGGGGPLRFGQPPSRYHGRPQSTWLFSWLLAMLACLLECLFVGVLE